MTHPWPLFDLRVRTSRLELRAPTDDDLVSLLELARAGIHDPQVMPFLVPWTDLAGAAFEQGFLKYYWETRASWSTADWALPLAVCVDGRPVGVQEVSSKSFPILRAVGTGSWLGRAHQGSGLGTAMRSAVLHLAFAGLGAEVAHSGAMEENVASARVSEKLGYVPNGEKRVAPRGQPVRERQFRLERAVWEARPRQAVEIIGLEACREMFG